MKFQALFAVRDIKAATAFYEELFGIKVIDDFGRCQGFDCGLVLQQDFDWLTGVPREEMKHRENNCELCFEIEAYDDFLQRLYARQDIELFHDVKTHAWGQRVIRFYDPDKHLIETGESIKAVVGRFLAQGKSMAEISEIMEVPIPVVQNFLK